MSSWKALAWAQDVQAGSPLGKLVLVLLCARADESFSCFPGVKTIAGEAEASRAGVQNALAMLREPLVREVDGRPVLVRGPLITVVQRYRPNGAQTTPRYLLNHPEAPHITGAGSVDNSPADAVENSWGGPTSRRGGAQQVGGGGPTSRPHGGPASRPLEPSRGTTTTTAGGELADVVVVEARGRKITLTRSVVERECDALAVAGWTPATLQASLRARSWDGVKGGAVIGWLRELGAPPAPEREAGPDPRGPWCGYCSHPTARRALDPTTGAVPAAPCPDCGGTP